MLKNKFYVYGENAQIPSHLHFGQQILDKMMEYKNQVAMVNSDTGVSLTYGEIAQKTVDIALSLARMGVRKGEVVSICSERRLEFIPTVLGVFCAGATFSPTDITYGAVPLLHRVKIARPKVMFCSPTAFDQHKGLFDTVGCIETYIVYDEETPGVRESTQHDDESKPGQNQKTQGLSFKDFLTERGDVNNFLSMPVDGWSDLLMILFSSGTTGLPKGVPWTHLALLVNVQANANKSFEGHGLLITREWYYSYGLIYTLAGLYRGATIVYSYTNAQEDWLAAIQNYKIRYLQLTPGSVTELIKSAILQEYDLSSVQGIISSSTTIMADQVRAVKDRVPNLRGVFQLYGTSEAGCVCTELGAPQGTRPGSVGVPTYGNIFKVVDLKSRQPLGPGKRGEVCFKSQCLTPGVKLTGPGCTNYFKDISQSLVYARRDPRAGEYLAQRISMAIQRGNAASVLGTLPIGYLGVQSRDFIDSEGFYKTGDLGYYDDDGYFYVVGRLKELIKYNDISVAPAELESILLQHPAVKEVGVVGAPHAEVGEAPTAFVVLQDGEGAAGDELVHFLEDRITFRMRLAGGVRFLEELPRGAMGKLDRNTLKKML